MCIYAHTHAYVYVWSNASWVMGMYVYIYIYMHICMHICTFSGLPLGSVDVHTVCVCKCKYVCVYACMRGGAAGIQINPFSVYM
jgi:hypothetical protein